MGRILGVVLAGATVLWLAGASLAQMGGMSGGMGGGAMGSGHMGSGMMGGDKDQAPEITAEQAEQAAVEYARQHLPGFAVTSTLPFTGMHMTMYQVELSGPGGETRVLHVNPWGNAMPMGGPVTR